MSGGSLDYFCYTLEDHANDLGDKELNDLVKDLSKLFHDYGIDYTLDNGEWACGGESYKTMVTHWMPLPEPPEEEEINKNVE